MFDVLEFWNDCFHFCVEPRGCHGQSSQCVYLLCKYSISKINASFIMFAICILLCIILSIS